MDILQTFWWKIAEQEDKSTSTLQAIPSKIWALTLIPKSISNPNPSSTIPISTHDDDGSEHYDVDDNEHKDTTLSEVVKIV